MRSGQTKSSPDLSPGWHNPTPSEHHMFVVCECGEVIFYDPPGVVPLCEWEGCNKPSWRKARGSWYRFCGHEHALLCGVQTKRTCRVPFCTTSAWYESPTYPGHFCGPAHARLLYKVLDREASGLPPSRCNFARCYEYAWYELVDLPHLSFCGATHALSYRAQHAPACSTRQDDARTSSSSASVKRPHPD
jgi:hypothetical protein